MKSEICMNCADKSCYGYDHRITECEDFQPMTNADRIRSLSDEELATWLVCNAFKNIDAFLNDLREQANISVSYPKDEKRLFENTVKWLKEEVQDGIL